MLKRLVFVPALVGLLSASVAAAALLDGVEDQTLAAGDALITSCGEVDTVEYGTAFEDGIGYVIESITVTFMDLGCDGKFAYPALADADDNTLVAHVGVGENVAGDTVTFDLTDQLFGFEPPPVSIVTEFHLIVSD